MPRPIYIALPGLAIFLLTLLHFLRTSETSYSFAIDSWKSPSRLALTLATNEDRYQEAIRNRYALIEKLGGPSIAAFPSPHTALYTLWDFYVPAYSCPFPVYRVGTLGDGGKWVCGLERALRKPNCVVYSMGVERQSSFEESILSRFPTCEIFGFDYTVERWGPQLLGNLTMLHRAHFNQYQISNVDNHDTIPKKYTMQGIMKEKGHNFVDILKMDIEGSEFTTLTALIESYGGEPLPFGQLQLEIHFGRSGWHSVGDFDKWWTVLERAGLRPFWTEPNLMHSNNFRSTPDVSEWSFINIRGMHPLVDDRLPETLL